MRQGMHETCGRVGLGWNRLGNVLAPRRIELTARRYITTPAGTAPEAVIGVLIAENRKGSKELMY